MVTLRRAVAAAAFVLLSVQAFAQQQVVTFEWHYERTQAEVNTYTHEVRIDGALQGSVAVICLPRAGAPTHTTCTTPITLSAGPHDLEVSATRNGVAAIGRLNRLDLASGPGAQRNPRVLVTVTVAVP